MPAWLENPALAAAIGALAVLVTTGLTNWANSKREQRAQQHQRDLQTDRAAIEKVEARLERRLDATLALVAELRHQIHAREEFKEKNGQTPAEVFDHIELRALYELLTPVLILCPDSVADAAQSAADECLAYVNDRGSEAMARLSIEALMSEARQAFT